MQLIATSIVIDPDAEQPVYLQIANQLLGLIKEGTLPTAQRLLSTRKLAELLKVHRKTIVRAYDELLVQGWLESEAGNGTFVSKNLPVVKLEKLPVNIGKQATPLKTAGYRIGTPAFLERKLLKHTTRYHLDDGYPDGRISPLTELSRAYRTQLRAGSPYSRLGYGDPKGSLWLREELSRFFFDSRGFNITAENILITRGTIMGIYLVSAALLQPGDNVVMGELGWMGANMNFLQAKANVLRIGVDQHGIVIEELRQLCLLKNIRLVYITPHHNYPTTVALRADRRMQLLNLAEEFGFIIFEDDYDYDFHYLNRPLQPLAGADKTGNVLYCGSFAKTIAPGFRVGYLVGPENVIQHLSGLRRIIDRQGDSMLESAIAELLHFGTIQKHLRRSLRIYRERRDAITELMKYHLLDKVNFQSPDGGMAVWTTFDPAINVKELLGKALKKDIYINDGSGQCSNVYAENSLRLGFASSTPSELEYMIETIGKLTR